MATLKLVVDEAIPYVRGMAEHLGTVRYLPGASITAADVADADALVVRTRTRCNEALLAHSHVRFIATATIGYDHLDTAWLAKAGIAWQNCPGCNAESVAQYFTSCMLLLAAHGCWHEGSALVPLTEAVQPAEGWREVFGRLTLGVVGVGHVGKAVCQAAERLGFGRIVACDPPRAERGDLPRWPLLPLDEVARQADVITLHTPLSAAPAPHPTFHLAHTAFFSQLKRGAVFVNSSRGEVTCTEALLQALQHGTVRAAVVDTWEHEPQPSAALLRQCFIATPHIAGYSADGKANGTRMALSAVARHFGLDATPFAAIKPPSPPQGVPYYPEGNAWRLAPELAAYDPTRDHCRLLAQPEGFEQQRSHYPLRREYHATP